MLQIQKRILHDLIEWDKYVLGEMETRINKVKKELENCRRQNISQEVVKREHLLRYKLERLQDQQNIYWKQRAHSTWLIKGDRNTKIFHAFASICKRKNYIKQLRDDNVGVATG